VTAYVIQDNYADETSEESLSDTVVEEFTEMKDKVVGNDSYFSGLTIIGLAIGLILAPLLARKFSGMSAGEVFIYLVRLVKQAVDIVVKVISWLVNLVKKR
jgi:tetrahydromethanopterin S-methyltransferase subunit F